MATKSKARVALLIATRKGAFMLSSDSLRRDWKLSAPIMLGNIVHHIVLDPRDRRTILMAARTGHLGPTVFRSADFGKRWKEAEKPPAFPKAEEGQKGLVLDHVFWLAPAHASEAGAWYAGSSPQGLFRSEDEGTSWEGVAGVNQNPMRETWTGGERDGTPDGPKMHSILIDPRDPNHMYIGMSSGGVFESRNKGVGWKPLNQGCAADFIPNPDPEYGHDPHCVRLHPLMPDRLYQQNHCGIYRMQREAAGSASERICRRRSAISAFLSPCTRATRIRSGSSRWMEPPSGHGRVRRANLLRTSRETRAKRGSARTTDCRAARHGGPSSGRP